MHALKITLLCLLLPSLVACGITAPRSNEGFADLDSLGMFDTDNSLTISLGPTVLRFAAAHIDDDPETKALLKNLDGVRIRIYEIQRNPDKVAARMTKMQQRMQQDGWEPVMLVRERDELMTMLVKFENDHIQGITLLTMEDAGEKHGEVVVINLMGEIRPQNFSKVMVALDVESSNARNVQVASLN